MLEPQKCCKNCIQKRKIEKLTCANSSLGRPEALALRALKGLDVLANQLERAPQPSTPAGSEEPPLDGGQSERPRAALQGHPAVPEPAKFLNYKALGM